MVATRSFPTLFGHLIVHLEAVSSDDHDRQHNGPTSESSSSRRPSFVGGAGVVHGIGSGVDAFNIGDLVMAILSTGTDQGLHEYQGWMLSASTACKCPDHTTASAAASAVESFRTAVAIVDSTRRVPLKFLRDDVGSLSRNAPTTVLILAGKSPVPLITICLLRNALPDSHILALYDYDPPATDAQFDIVKPMEHGATYARKPQLSETPDSILESHRKLSSTILAGIVST